MVARFLFRASALFSFLLILFTLVLGAHGRGHRGVTRHYTFHVRLKNVTRLCQRKPLITVNGRFPGPCITVHEGDRVIVRVKNHVSHNITIHWHGVRQLQSGWSDGPEYITQCPIQKGMSYVYNFRISEQRGTLWWHAHVSWLRATVYGAFLIYPRAGVPYPFPKPHKELPPLLLGEWWNADTEAVVKQALLNGGGPNVSDAYTFNGLPGPLYAYTKPNNTLCSSPNKILKQTFVMNVVAGKTYLLRIINAALNGEHFFAIANHTLTVVEVDASYTKPFQTQTLHMAPGQATNVLFTAQSSPSKQMFLMAARPSFTGSGSFDNSTVAGVLCYTNASHPRNGKAALKSLLLSPNSTLQRLLPPLPAVNDTNFAANFSKSLRSLGSKEYPVKVPRQVDRRLFFTVGLGLDPCEMGMNKTNECQGPNGTRFSASINNVSMLLPSKSLLESYFSGHSNGVFSTAFPDNPPFTFDYTGTPPNNTMPARGTRVKVVDYDTSVELVLQGTSIGGTESHPLHLHGHNVFVVARGMGNFNATLLRHPNSNVTFINMVDPAKRNTVDVPKGGWAVVRFRTDNPGVWLIHCHIDIHLSWGLRTALLVKNGVGPRQSLPPPPRDLPPC